MSTTVTLRLKLRPVRDGELRMPIGVARTVLESGETEGSRFAFQAISRAIGEAELVEHDVKWLLKVAQWTSPKDGLKLVDAARWLPLIKRLSNIDRLREAKIKLSETQADLIFDRLTHDPEYRYVGGAAISANEAAFLLDLWADLGRKPDTIKSGDEFDEEPVYVDESRLQSPAEMETAA